MNPLDLVNLAIPFKLHNDKYDEIADEFNILFRENRNSKEKLIEFAEAYPDKRINLEMDKLDISFLGILNKAHNRLYIRITDIADMQYVEALKEKGIKFFFDSTLITASDMYMLHHLISLGVSDAYLSDYSLYQLEEIADAAHSHDVNLRLILNVVPSTVPVIDTATAPWFPPDCMNIIGKYIDTIEFECGDPYDWGKFGVFYRAWFERQNWHGDLGEIIAYLDIFVPNDALLTQDLISYKIQCGKKCTNANSHCRKCYQYIDIAHSLVSKNIGLNKNPAEYE